jgi:uncharacterized protein YbjT (DUF2867 family)
MRFAEAIWRAGMGVIVVIGATGLIGSHIAAELVRLGHEVVGVARHVDEARFRQPTVRWESVELGKAGPRDWAAVLRGCDAVVNCAGALQDSPSDDLAKTHETGLQGLVAACETSGVQRFIHFSAMGVDKGTPTKFSRSKLAGDKALMVSGVDWVILRPSVVLGSAAYGASALIRGLAALPLLPVMPDTGLLRPVALDDVVATVVLFLDPTRPGRMTLDLSGPEQLSFAELVKMYRAWLGFAPARQIVMPGWLAGAFYRLGDLVAHLGWRPPVRSTARTEIARGAAGVNEEWVRRTEIAPRSITSMLTTRPASVQERWFAGLYLLKPAILGSLALFWVGSGLASLGPGYAAGIAMLRQGGVEAMAPFAVVAGGLADLLVGIGIAVRPFARPAILAGLAVSLGYALAGSVVTPWLWLDPLAALLKIAPVMALHGAALATLGDR